MFGAMRIKEDILQKSLVTGIDMIESTQRFLCAYTSQSGQSLTQKVKSFYEFTACSC
jgi:hypothetical protein